MPKNTGKVLDVKITSDGRLLAKVEFDRGLPPRGTLISVKWGSTRSLPQNSLYWVYLHWVINEGGLKDHGHFCEQALHDNLKHYLLAEKKLFKDQFKAVGTPTTTDLTKSEFSEYMEAVDQFICEFFNIDTSAFWEEHKQKTS